MAESEETIEQSTNSILVLTPTKIDPTDKAYKSVTNLQHALGNNEITNIALTGPYGSGKSSILKTLKEAATDYTFLNISLATLEANEALVGENKKEVKPDPNCPLEKCKATEKKKEDKDLSQLVEYSILQQIIYKEKPESIPQSRFKRIKHISYDKSHKFAIQCVGLIVSVLILIKPDWFVNNHLYKMVSFDRSIELLYEILSLGYTIFALYSFIRYLTVTLYNNSLNKINLKDGEIEISETTSIFNKHLDEIIYFFEVTPYNVIVFEDLDRFKDHNIFLKLRELNTLINESRSVNRRIIFIYAVRDDIFKDTSRTKFFDYIETIIPVINPSNACDQLRNLLIPFVSETEIPSKVYGELGQYIDDMRTLKNIVNEFVQYRTRLDEKLVPSKMLGMIVYKNYYPEDFSSLHNNGGILNDLIKNKEKYISESISTTSANIKMLKSELIEVEKKNRIYEIELRTIYVHKYIESIDRFISFVSEDANVYSITDVINSNDLFEQLRTNQMNNYNYASNQNPARINLSSLNKTFEEVEKQIDIKNSYQKRLEQINEGYNLKIVSDIEKLENDIANINSLPLKEIILKYDCKEYHDVADKDKYRQIDFLLQQGYIEEDYYKYISYFYPGTITPSDHEFLLDLMRRKKYDYSYQLQNVEVLIDQIQSQFYKTDAILNLSLVSHIAEHSSKYKKEINWITDVIFKRKNIEFTRLLYTQSSTVYPFDFYNLLFLKWKDFWIEVQHKVEKADELKLMTEIYLQFRPTVVSRLDNQQFSTHLNENYSLVYDAYDKLNLSDIINTLKLLECKFIAFFYIGQGDILFTKAVELNLYEVNAGNIKEILKLEGKDDAVVSYGTASYTTILENCKEITIAYINTQLDKCLKSIFPTSSVLESEKTLVALLNMNDNLLNSEIRDNYLLNQTYKIGDLKKINDQMWSSALILNIIKPSWENISLYFESVKYTLDSELVDFVEENIDTICDIIVPDTLNQEIVERLFIDFIGSNELSLEAYKQLNPLFQKSFDNYDLSQLEEERIFYLIQNNGIEYSDYNYKMIDENFSYKTIFEFFKQNKNEFLDDLGNHSLDEELIARLIDSTLFTNVEKQNILDTNLLDTSITKKETADILLRYCISYETADIAQQCMFKILSLCSRNNTRIKFATILLNKLGWSQRNITIVLETLGDKYGELTKKRVRPIFKNTQENKEFLEKLKLKGYISKVIPKDDKIKVTTKYK